MSATGNYYNETICSQAGGGAPTLTVTCSWNVNQLDSGLYSIQAFASDVMNNGGYDTITIQVGSSS